VINPRIYNVILSHKNKIVEVANINPIIKLIIVSEIQIAISTITEANIPIITSFIDVIKYGNIYFIIPSLKLESIPNLVLTMEIE
jgi:hypothetical protein